MKTKHTPGPWYYSGGDSLAIFHPTEIGTRLAVVDQTFSGSGWQVTANDEWEANAKLIAAAPELLDALENLLVSLNSYDEKDLDAINQAKEAIKKATS